MLPDDRLGHGLGHEQSLLRVRPRVHAWMAPHQPVTTLSRFGLWKMMSTPSTGINDIHENHKPKKRKASTLTPRDCKM